MGRFESTAASYAAHREPYPPAFFAAAAKTLALTGREALIDLGTGPGLLALGFARYVGRLLGIDPEPAMIAEAHTAAASAGVLYPLVLGRAEDFVETLGWFDLVTIGRALHWMERAPTLAAFDRMLAPGGRILLCGSRTSDANPWRAAFERVSRGYGGARDSRHRAVYEHFFDDAAFGVVAEVEVEHRQPTSAEDLVARALTRSTTSPAALGGRLDTFKAELRAALTPFFPAGEAEEIVVVNARVFAAR